ncbi:uncharacterized protein LOC144329361 [Macaca mulatta]|uniref:uncharacterized protein LOC114672378 n=1 Tax=Macaca mulatta TaxID=9544 RepID=UPI0010A25005|nr:uncharacterized protein LOC114672378 [Macaca mulatta]
MATKAKAAKGTSTPRRADTPSRRNLGGRSRRRGRPFPHPRLKDHNGILFQIPPSKWRLRLPTTLSILPSSRRLLSAILPPVPPPLRGHLHSENRPSRPPAFTSRLQPSPPRQASPPCRALGLQWFDPRSTNRLPNKQATFSHPCPLTERTSASSQGGRIIPRPNCGLLGACSAPSATPAGLAREGALRDADQATSKLLRAH